MSQIVNEPSREASRASAVLPSRDHKQRIREFWEAAWNRGELAAVDELLAPEYARYSIDPEVRDRQYVKDSIRDVRAAFPDLHSTIDDLIAEGDKVVISWSATGTQLGDFLGFPATGTSVITAGVLISRFVGDRIVEEWATWNALDLLRDLGVIKIV
jgi:steroid delta-isomerase-like uncharacterized protein